MEEYHKVEVNISTEDLIELDLKNATDFIKAIVAVAKTETCIDEENKQFIAEYALLIFN